MKRRLFATLLVIAVLSLLATSTAAHPPVQKDDGYNKTENGFPLDEFLKLWSLDGQDKEVSNDMNSAVFMAKAFDHMWSDPPSSPKKWNTREVSNFDSGGDSKSVYPKHAELHSNEVVEDAYVHIFAINPSTVMRKGDKNTYYVTNDGAITGTTDYRLNVTNDKTNGWPKKIYKTNVSKVSLVRAYAVTDSGRTLLGKDVPSDGAWKINYDNLPDNTERIEVVATINVTVDMKKHLKPPVPNSGTPPTVTPSNPSDDDDTTNPPGCRVNCGAHQSRNAPDSILNSQFAELGPKFQHKNDTTGKVGEHLNATNTYNMTVSYSKEVKEQHVDPKAMVAKMPDGTYEIRVWTAGSVTWDRMETPIGSVETVWQYYVHRNTKWDTLVESTGDGNDDKNEVHSSVHPVKSYAYPSSGGSFTQKARQLTILKTYGLSLGKVDYNENISVLTNDERAVNPFYMVFDYEAKLENPDTLPGFSFHKLGGGEEKVEVTDYRVVKTPELSVEVIELYKKNNTAKLRVKLIDPETGKHIKTFSGDTLTQTTASKANMEDKRESYLIANGKKFETYSRNETVVLVDFTSGTPITVKYVPMAWHAQPDRPNVYAETTRTVGTYANTVVGGFLTHLFTIFAQLIPFLLLMKILDNFLEMDLWPPYPPRW